MAARETTRQRQWRARQAEEGLVQVRLWVPKERKLDAEAMAASWRAGKPGREPEPGQLYKVRKAIAANPSLRPPNEDVLADAVRLAIWLALHEPSRKYGSSKKAAKKQRQQRRALYRTRSCG